MTTPSDNRRIFSHLLMHLRADQGSRWRIGYQAEPADAPGTIRANRAVAAQIADDVQALRAEALAMAEQSAEFYEDVICEVDGSLPRIEMHGDHLVADWRHVVGDPDGRYTIGLDLGWQQVTPALCDAIRDASTWPSQTFLAYQAYVGCFTDPTAALLDLAEQAGIAIAYLDRGAIEADSRTLADDEWALIRDELHQYDEHVSSTDDLNALFLDQIFDDADLDRYRDDADTTDTATA